MPFTNDHEVLAGGLAGLTAEGETALHDSLVYALHYFSGLRGKRALILLSDGEDVGSAYTFDEALDFARRTGVPIYTIGLGVAQRDAMARTKLVRLAQDTGGRSFFIDSAEGLTSVYKRIETELRAQYLIAYQSSQGSEGGDTLSRGRPRDQEAGHEREDHARLLPLANGGPPPDPAIERAGRASCWRRPRRAAASCSAASASTFDIRPAAIDETPFPGEEPRAHVERVGAAEGESGGRRRRDRARRRHHRGGRRRDPRQAARPGRRAAHAPADPGPRAPRAERRGAARGGWRHARRIGRERVAAAVDVEESRSACDRSTAPRSSGTSAPASRPTRRAPTRCRASAACSSSASKGRART